MGLRNTGLNSEVVLILGGLNSDILLYINYFLFKLTKTKQNIS